MSVENSDPCENPNANSEALASRIVKIEDSLVKESWLPFSLRGLLATELPQVLKTLQGGGTSWRRKVAKQLFVLSLATWVYGPSPLESKTISQLQALDLEINGTSTFESDQKN